MRKLSSNPKEAQRQLALFKKIDQRKQVVGSLYKGQFRSDAEGIINDTITALREELTYWEQMLSEDETK